MKSITLYAVGLINGGSAMLYESTGGDVSVTRPVDCGDDPPAEITLTIGDDDQIRADDEIRVTVDSLPTVRRVVLRGDKFRVARILADAGIPFIHRYQDQGGVRQEGNTVGDVPAQHIPALEALLADRPELEGRYDRQEGQIEAQRLARGLMAPQPPVGVETHNCRNCVHFSVQTESWEMPWIRWVECDRHPGYENLTSFPFKHTQCADFKARNPTPSTPTP